MAKQINLLYFCFSLMIFSSTGIASEKIKLKSQCNTHEHSNQFNSLALLACPLFASYSFGELELSQAQNIRRQEKKLRELLKVNGINAEVKIKIGVNVVSEEEVWFIPEVGFFYQKEKQLEKFQAILQATSLLAPIQLRKDELSVYGIFQGYVSVLEAGQTVDSQTFMSAPEWLELSGEDRINFLKRQNELITKLRNSTTLELWNLLLLLYTPSGHYLHWEVIDGLKTSNLRLSTYFDYQWFSASLPDNSTLASELMEEFEVDLFHLPSQNTSLCKQPAKSAGLRFSKSPGRLSSPIAFGTCN